MRKIISLFALALLTTSAWATNTYVKVTSVDQLEAGVKYIIVNEESSRAMGEITGTNTTYGSYVDITIDNGVIDIDGTNVVELTAYDTGETAYGDTWAFSTEDGVFIIWVSGNSLNLVSGPGSIGAGAAGAKWLPKLTDDGVILRNNSDTNRILQYNAGAPRFACYASTQKPAVLYKQGAPEDEGITTLSQANALDDNEYFAFNGKVVVTLQKDNYLFVRDETGFGQIRGADATFEKGQVLNPSWEGVKTSNDGWAWFYNPAGLTASGETNTELAAPIVLTGAVDESMLNAYVCIENQTPPSGGSPFFPSFPARYYTLPDNTTIDRTEILWGVNADAGNQNYNVYGIICKVDGTLKLNPVGFAPYVPQPEGLRGDVNGDGAVNIKDVSALINYLLTGDDTGINFIGADADLSETINLSDMAALINYLLVGSWE